MHERMDAWNRLRKRGGERKKEKERACGVVEVGYEERGARVESGMGKVNCTFFFFGLRSDLFFSQRLNMLQRTYSFKELPQAFP